MKEFSKVLISFKWKNKKPGIKSFTSGSLSNFEESIRFTLEIQERILCCLDNVLSDFDPVNHRQGANFEQLYNQYWLSKSSHLRTYQNRTKQMK